MESVNFTNPFFIFTVLIGVSVLLLMYFINLFKHQDKPQINKNENLVSQSTSEKKKDLQISGKRVNKKKIPDNRWSGKHDKNSYNHQWLLVSLKGHTGNILDMDFSSNGKYLVSCDDEDPDPGGDSSPNSSISQKSIETVESNPNPKGLSRRQRKNRRREDISPSDNNQKHKKIKPKKIQEIVISKKQIMSVVPSPQYIRLQISEKVFTQLLQNYLLNLDQMMAMGYPIQSSEEPTVVIIYKSPRLNIYPVHKTIMDVNAREFIPKNDWSSSSDSGQGSGSSSEEESSISSTDSNNDTEFNSYFTRICSRCTKSFYTTNDKYITKEKCLYHWGRLHNNDKKNIHLRYTCCQNKIGSKGCTEAKLHVWTGLNTGMNGLYGDFVVTKQRKNPPIDGNYGLYSLDCEMCYTVRGLELTKITVVGMDGRLVYDSYVKPDSEIIDYNSRFSGITAKDLKRNSTKSLKEVQNDLMGFINADTILVGHGLENDLRALRLVHYINVDTAHTFPHWLGLPYRRSLKSLTSSILKKNIQNSENGHNSYEDASACMELMLWRVRKDYKKTHINF